MRKMPAGSPPVCPTRAGRGKRNTGSGLDMRHPCPSAAASSAPPHTRKPGAHRKPTPLPPVSHTPSNFSVLHPEPEPLHGAPLMSRRAGPGTTRTVHPIAGGPHRSITDLLSMTVGKPITRSPLPRDDQITKPLKGSATLKAPVVTTMSVATRSPTAEGMVSAFHPPDRRVARRAHLQPVAPAAGEQSPAASEKSTGTPSWQ